MLILISFHVQYSQKAVFSFEKGSGGQNHYFSSSHHLVKDFWSPHWGVGIPPPLKAIENPGNGVQCVFLFFLKFDNFIKVIVRI